MPAYYTPADHLQVACIKAAKANHYCIFVRAPENATYDDAVCAAQAIFDLHNCGRISYALENRALILLSEATGYSLSDLGA
jgi:cytidine deaminase